MSHITCHMPFIMDHASYAIYHMSYATCHLSHIMRHLSGISIVGRTYMPSVINRMSFII